MLVMFGKPRVEQSGTILPHRTSRTSSPQQWRLQEGLRGSRRLIREAFCCCCRVASHGMSPGLPGAPSFSLRGGSRGCSHPCGHGSRVPGLLRVLGLRPLVLGTGWLPAETLGQPSLRPSCQRAPPLPWPPEVRSCGCHQRALDQTPSCDSIYWGFVPL